MFTDADAGAFDFASELTLSGFIEAATSKQVIGEREYTRHVAKRPNWEVGAAAKVTLKRKAAAPAPAPVTSVWSAVATTSNAALLDEVCTKLALER